MRTATSKEAEILAYEKLGDASIIMGAVRTLYRRHHEGFNMFFCMWIGFGLGLITGVFG